MSIRMADLIQLQTNAGMLHLPSIYIHSQQWQSGEHMSYRNLTAAMILTMPILTAHADVVR